MSRADGAGQVAIGLRLLEALLRRATDVPEIKVVLQTARLAAASGSPRVLLKRLLEPDSADLVIGRSSPEPAEARLVAALERAVADGFLRRVAVRVGEQQQDCVFLATPENDRLLAALRDGAGDAEAALDLPSGEEIIVHRPNAFSLYEQHIGPLTPLIAEHLRAAERAYPRDWLEEAILQAAEYNARTWRYVDAILQRWEAEGRPGVTVR